MNISLPAKMCWLFIVLNKGILSYLCCTVYSHASYLTVGIMGK